MKTVLIVVLVIVAGTLVYFAATQMAKPVQGPDVKTPTASTVENLPYVDRDLSKKGVPATGEPNFDVQVGLEKNKGRNTFHFTIIEAHGWAANGIYVELRHEGLPENLEGRGKMPDRRVEILCDKSPLRFDTPLKHSATVMSHEFPELTDWGTSENWKARVSIHSDLTAKAPP
ncbi:MAG: hypothetical protein V2A79_13640 [Planctomycetota bacterium]